jgi:hypothetical protein
MGTCACPVCSRETSPLPHLSETALVYYFRCDGCRHIWTVDKEDPAITNDVTPRPSTPKKPGNDSLS